MGKYRGFSDVISNLAKGTAISVKYNPRIPVPFTDLWLKGALTFGKKIGIIGQPNFGKSTLIYVIIGVLLQTCKRCYTKAMYFKNPKDGKEVFKCKCGKNDFMNVILSDNELRADPPYLRMLGSPIALNFTEHLHEDYLLRFPEEANKKCGNLLIVCSSKLSSVYSMVCNEIKLGEYDVFIMDALNSIPNDKRAAEYKVQPGDMAKAHSEGLHNIQSAQIDALKENRMVTILWTNHLTMKFGANVFDTKAIEAGGFSPKHYEDQCINIYSKRQDPDEVTGLEKRPDEAIVSEYKFMIDKSVTGMFENARGSYQIFQRSHETAKGKFYPGDNWENVKLFRICDALGLKVKDGKEYVLFGNRFSKEKDIYAYLKDPIVQLEAKYWIGQLASTDLVRYYIKEEDYIYSPFRDEKRIESVRKEIEKLRGNSGVDRPKDLPESKSKSSKRKTAENLVDGLPPEEWPEEGEGDSPEIPPEV